MTCNRLLVAGILCVLIGLQFRLVESFVLNERVSGVINAKLADASTETLNVSRSSDDWWDQPDPVPMPAKRVITPPRWLGWSLISVGAVMTLTCPCFKKNG